MKKLPIILRELMILSANIMLLGSCQEEIKPQVEIDENGILSKDPISGLIVAVATKDGSFDNIIDQSSCTTTKFPITGLLNDQEFSFNTLEDVIALGSQALEIEWIFPIVVILSDHSEVTLNNEGELEDIRKNCIEGGNDADIECIDFIYPFTIRIFEGQSESVETTELSSDKETYNTFSAEDLVISIEYPLTLVNSESISLQASANEELMTIITDNGNICDEEDITEFEDQFIVELEKLFISSNWRITVFEEDNNDNTSLFSGYSFQFDADLTLQAVGAEVIEGEWEIQLLDNGESISIEFDTDDQSFILLNREWKIISYEPTKIDMEFENTEEGTKRLHLTSN